MLDNTPVNNSLKCRIAVVLVLLSSASLPMLAQQAKQQPNQISAKKVEALPSGSTKNAPARPSKHYLRQLEFEVLGSSCYACIRKIEMDLRAIPGVEIAKASNLTQPPVVTVVYDMDKTKPEMLVKNVQSGGYTVRNQRDSFFKITRDPEAGKSKFTLYDLPGLRPSDGTR